MKAVLSIFVLFAVCATVYSQTCANSCTSSVECARNAGGNMDCRCSFLSCGISESKCSGGCIADSQCYDWSGEENCVCTWWFECDYSDALKNPGYKPLLKMAEMAKLNKEKRAALISGQI